MDMGAISGHAFLDNKGLYSMESCNGRILLDKYTNSCYYRIQTFVFKSKRQEAYAPGVLPCSGLYSSDGQGDLCLLCTSCRELWTNRIFPSSKQFSRTDIAFPSECYTKPRKGLCIMVECNIFNSSYSLFPKRSAFARSKAATLRGFDEPGRKKARSYARPEPGDCLGRVKIRCHEPQKARLLGLESSCCFRSCVT